VYSKLCPREGSELTVLTQVLSLAHLVYLRFTIYDLLDTFAILAAIKTMRPVRLVA
jgi:hypothetical protein